MASSKQSWYEQLISNSRDYTSPALQRAALLLPRWHNYASQLPVHDALDKIYDQGDILKSYQRQVPDYLRNRVNTNLQYLIEMALDLDSGRYPSMQLFLWKLQQAKVQLYDAPEHQNSQEQSSVVKILTIHAAKGLEAAVVFLVDTARPAQAAKPYKATVDWPIDSIAPQQLFMRPDKKRQDSGMRATLDRLTIDDKQEDCHLLYVAITRAKQYLYVSGVKPLKGDDQSWLSIINSQCVKQQWGVDSESGSIIVESGLQESLANMKNKSTATVPPAMLQLPDTASNLALERDSISPSSSPESAQLPMANDLNSDEIIATQRGQTIHRAIELLCQNLTQSETIRQILSESDQDISQFINEYVEEAIAVVNHQDFQFLFNDDRILAAYNEIPFSFINADEKIISGIVDRVVVHKDDIYIIDYKTHRNIPISQVNTLAISYQSQMDLYAQGIKKIWDTHRIHQIIILTHPTHLINLSNLNLA